MGCTALFRLGQRGLQTPDIVRWQEHDETAWDSAPLLDRWRATAHDSEGGGSGPPPPASPGQTRPTALRVPAGTAPATDRAGADEADHLGGSAGQLGDDAAGRLGNVDPLDG